MDKNKEFLSNRNEWPGYPYAYLQRDTDQLNTGFLMADDKELVVYCHNLCSILNKSDEDYVKILQTCPKLHYGSLDLLLSDGWRID